MAWQWLAVVGEEEDQKQQKQTLQIPLLIINISKHEMIKVVNMPS